MYLQLIGIFWNEQKQSITKPSIQSRLKLSREKIL
jgi:hypothetical protein